MKGHYLESRITRAARGSIVTGVTLQMVKYITVDI